MVITKSLRYTFQVTALVIGFLLVAVSLYSCTQSIEESDMRSNRGDRTPALQGRGRSLFSKMGKNNDELSFGTRGMKLDNSRMLQDSLKKLSILIFGSSGSGKTSLVNIMCNCNFPVDSGRCCTTEKFISAPIDGLNVSLIDSPGMDCKKECFNTAASETDVWRSPMLGLFCVIPFNNKPNLVCSQFERLLSEKNLQRYSDRVSIVITKMDHASNLNQYQKDTSSQLKSMGVGNKILFCSTTMEDSFKEIKNHIYSLLSNGCTPFHVDFGEKGPSTRQLEFIKVFNNEIKLKKDEEERQRKEALEREYSRREQEVSRKEYKLSRREQEVSSKEYGLSRREQEVSSKEYELSRREQEVSRKESEWSRRTDEGYKKLKGDGNFDIELLRGFALNTILENVRKDGEKKFDIGLQDLPDPRSNIDFTEAQELMLKIYFCEVEKYLEKKPGFKKEFLSYGGSSLASKKEKSSFCSLM